MLCQRCHHSSEVRGFLENRSSWPDAALPMVNSRMTAIQLGVGTGAGVPFNEGLEAFGFDAAAFFGLRSSLPDFC
ncbi:hypothetical protein NOVOSPHI9U_310037 [Novosphingobium sp. 9U]|nr:hypothetical protein NOVOSPHI9U_310037 [Novosphingobium sp. 9U]